MAGGEPGSTVRRHEEEFLDLLRERIELRRDREYRLLRVECGHEIAVEARRLAAAADVVIALVSPGYRALPPVTRRRPELEALEALLPPHVNALDLPLAELHQATRPFSRLRGEQRVAFVDECLTHISDRLAELPREPALDCVEPDFDGFARLQAARYRAAGHLVEADAHETDLARHSFETTRHLGKRVSAVDRLTRWATEGSSPVLCALLGDVGTGKSTTTKLLTEQLLERRERDPSAPLPLLFDLRDLPLDTLHNSSNLRRIIGALLAAADNSPHAVPSVDDVLTVVANGNCVLIFDGLDEVLVHLEPHAGKSFTRTLWRATEDSWQTEGRPERPSKLLLSCRTHYFRSINDETNHLAGQHRDGPAVKDYLTLLMLPFTDGQIREYIRANLPDSDVDACLELIDSVHNLREIAERPMTLRMITDRLEVIERARLDGRTVRAVDLYASFVAQWLERDDGKHSLLPEHKQLLMEHLAAQLWGAAATDWSVTDVEQWLVDFMATHPELERHYARRAPTLWKEDLRTATFLVRGNNDRFAFAHTSLREYFLARYLLRGLQAGPDRPDAARPAWSLPVPSRETLGFLGQLIAGHGDRLPEELRRVLIDLAGSVPGSPAAVLAFAYGLAAVVDDHPHHPLSASRLDGGRSPGVADRGAAAGPPRPTWRVTGGRRYDRYPDATWISGTRT